MTDQTPTAPDTPAPMAPTAEEPTPGPMAEEPTTVPTAEEPTPNPTTDAPAPSPEEPTLAQVPADAPTPSAAEPPDRPPEPRTVGRVVADALRAAGVRYAFTVPGESFLGLLDALEGAGIRVIATRHEGGAAFMAEAYGQLTGRPAACIATRAVGSANMAIGIHTARQDSTPMFAIVGQVERAHRGHEAFQEIDQVASIGGLAKWAVEPQDVTDIGPAMTEAVHQAIGGRPGPVLISLAEDLLDVVTDGDIQVTTSRATAPRPADGDVRAVIELLASARRPVILAGGGVLRARSSTELLRFADLLQVPVIAAWRRGDVIDNDHPLYLGMAGYGAPESVRTRLEAADAMLVIGCRLNEPTSSGDAIPAEATRWAHVDVDPRPTSGSPPRMVVTADARAFLRSANQRLLGKAVLDAALVRERQEANGRDRTAWEASTIVDRDDVSWVGPGVHPGKTVLTLRSVLPDDAIVTTDAGNFGGWAARGFRFRRPGTFLGPTSGAMGYGLPAAIAAALVHRDRPVVALVGDGGMAMTMAELETAVREGARVIVIVFDNERYGTIRMWQDRRGSGQGIATELGPIDFAGIGRSMGARGVRVDRDDAFEPALRQALVEPGPVVIHLALDRAWASVADPAPSSPGLG